MPEILTAEGVFAKRGASMILQGVDFVMDRPVSGIVGRNGMGKTTLAHTIMGIIKCDSGTIRFNDEVISGLRTDQVARRGIAYVPQGRGLFASLTVAEHLSLAGRLGKAAGQNWDADAIFGLYPRLKERLKNKANNLSGGEQQMLAIARALLLNPHLIIMDEPSEGLAPVVVAELIESINSLTEQGMSVLLIEQSLPMIAECVPDEVMVMDRGRIRERVRPRDLVDDPQLRERILGVSQS
jgi:branched-chain amino acid transport system ATP-binding protein